jgi:hypothetical protein
MKAWNRSRKKVENALKSAQKQVRQALNDVNRQAGKTVAKGDYTGAELLVEVAKKIQGFQVEVDALLVRWKAINSGNQDEKKEIGDITPLWKFYQPILKALIALGGEARRHAIEAHLESSFADKLLPGDLKPTRGGIPRWKVMIKRAGKPMLKEGFLDGGSVKTWRISREGRRIAQETNVDTKPSPS